MKNLPLKHLKSLMSLNSGEIGRLNSIKTFTDAKDVLQKRIRINMFSKENKKILAIIIDKEKENEK